MIWRQVFVRTASIHLSEFGPHCGCRHGFGRAGGRTLPGMNRAVSEILHQTGGVVSRRKYPDLANRLDNLRRTGELESALPGVYVHRDVSSDWRVLVQAVREWDNQAILTGDAAAALSYWPELNPGIVQVAGRRTVFRRSRISVSRRIVPPDLVVERHGVRMTAPALTAMDLVPRHGGDSIDRALRSRMATLDGMREALNATPGRVGNADRRLMLLDSRDEPWSGGERQAHRLLRADGVTGWHTNVPIVCDGHKFYLDIAMDDCPVVIEIDGRIHLRDDIFESDRFRGNCLLLAGKQVLHYTSLMLDTQPEWFLSTVRRAIDIWR